MENYNVKLADGEVAVLFNDITMIMNTSTLVDVYEKLYSLHGDADKKPTGKDEDSAVEDTPCGCGCNGCSSCECEAKESVDVDVDVDKLENNTNTSNYDGYMRLLKAVLEETPEYSTEEADDKDMFKELKSLVDKLISECDEDEEEDYDEEDDEEEDYDEEEDDDEDEENDHPRRIVAVAYDASISYDSSNKCPKPWHTGLGKVIGTFSTPEECVEKFRITGSNPVRKVVDCCDTWQTIGDMMHKNFSQLINYDRVDDVVSYAYDTFGKVINNRIYCACDEYYNGVNSDVAFLYEDDIDKHMPLYHKELLGE